METDGTTSGASDLSRAAGTELVDLGGREVTAGAFVGAGRSEPVSSAGGSVGFEEGTGADTDEERFSGEPGVEPPPEDVPFASKKLCKAENPLEPPATGPPRDSDELALP